MGTQTFDSLEFSNSGAINAKPIPAESGKASKYKEVSTLISIGFPIRT